MSGTCTFSEITAVVLFQPYQKTIIAERSEANNRVLWAQHSQLAFIYIMEYVSTPYVGMGTEKNGFPIKCVQNDMFITQL